jgi:hypothetical protein
MRFSASTTRAHYDRRKEAGDRHAGALRNLFGRLHHCLTTGQHYDEATAFPARSSLTANPTEISQSNLTTKSHRMSQPLPARLRARSLTLTPKEPHPCGIEILIRIGRCSCQL